MEDAESFYAVSSSAQFYNRLAQKAIESLVATFLHDQQLRLLEIGAGTGATTANILPVVPANNCEYWFTDLSITFLKRAQARWHILYPFVRYSKSR